MSYYFKAEKKNNLGAIMERYYKIFTVQSYLLKKKKKKKNSYNIRPYFFFFFYYHVFLYTFLLLLLLFLAILLDEYSILRDTLLFGAAIA